LILVFVCCYILYLYSYWKFILFLLGLFILYYFLQHGDAPILLASRYGHVQLIEKLKSLGANVVTVDKVSFWLSGFLWRFQLFWNVLLMLLYKILILLILHTTKILYHHYSFTNVRAIVINKATLQEKSIQILFDPQKLSLLGTNYSLMWITV